MKVWTAILRAFKISLAVLREIFDEAAYARFLVCHELAPGAETYADFCRDHQQGKVRLPRCC